MNETEIQPREIYKEKKNRNGWLPQLRILENDFDPIRVQQIYLNREKNKSNNDEIRIKNL